MILPLGTLIFNDMIFPSRLVETGNALLGNTWQQGWTLRTINFYNSASDNKPLVRIVPGTPLYTGTIYSANKLSNLSGFVQFSYSLAVGVGNTITAFGLTVSKEEDWNLGGTSTTEYLSIYERLPSLVGGKTYNIIVNFYIRRI